MAGVKNKLKDFILLFKPRGGFLDFDKPLLIFGTIVFVIGLLTAISASATSYSTAKSQVGYSCVGFVLCIAVASRPRLSLLSNRAINHLLWILMVGLIVITALIGEDRNNSGTNRYIGIAGHYFQPSELVKLLLIMYFAYKIWRYNTEFRSLGFEPDRRLRRLPRGGKSFLSCVEIVACDFKRVVMNNPSVYCTLTKWLVIASLVKQNHFSAVFIVWLTCFFMEVLALKDKRILIFKAVFVTVVIGVFVGALAMHYNNYKQEVLAAETAGISVPRNPEEKAADLRDEAEYTGDTLRATFYKIEEKVWHRFIPYFDRDEILSDGSFDYEQQPNQALMAIAKGGWTGVGYLNSTQKLGALYASNNDAIMAIFLEEFGIVGFIFVMFFISLMLHRMLMIAAAVKDTYSRMLVVGIFLLMSVQILLHMMINTFMLPYMGVEFPFFSTGGSSTIVAYIEFGLVLGISRDTRIKGISLLRGGVKSK